MKSLRSEAYASDRFYVTDMEQWIYYMPYAILFLSIRKSDRLISKDVHR